MQHDAGLVDTVDPIPLLTMPVVEDVPFAGLDLRGGSLSTTVLSSPAHSSALEPTCSRSFLIDRVNDLDDRASIGSTED